MLAELAEIGMELARKVGRQALEEAGSTSEADGGAGLRGDLGLVFARIARAARQTVALEARLEADARALEQRGTEVQASREATQRARMKQQKVRMRRLVEATISVEVDPGDAENLRLDLDERLENPDVEAELGWRPIGVIYAGIRQDLGIEADLRQFSDAELGFDIQPGRIGGLPGGRELAGGGKGVDGRDKPGHDGGGGSDDPEDTEESAAALAFRLSLPTGPPD